MSDRHLAYLIVDPVGRYPAERCRSWRGAEPGRGGVFSSRARLALWQGKWSKQVGDTVLDSYLAPGAPSLAVLAAEIRARWPELLGVVSWDEESVQLGAALAEDLGLGWNSRRVIERCRNKAVMKEHLRRTGRIRVNAGAVVRDAAQARAFQRQVGSWPIVVKPTGGAGSEHVFFARHEAAVRPLPAGARQRRRRGAARRVRRGSRTASTAGGPPGDLLAPTSGSTTGGRATASTTSTSRPPRWRRATALRPARRLRGEGGRGSGLRRPHPPRGQGRRQGRASSDRCPPRRRNLPVLATACPARLLELAACHYLGELPRAAATSTRALRPRARPVVLGVQPVPSAHPRRARLAEVHACRRSSSRHGSPPVGTGAPQTIDLDRRAGRST